MAGRRPKPTAVKEAAGNPGRRPLNHLEPKPQAGLPEKPTYLTALAAEEWDRIVVQLQAMKVLTQADGTALASYCMAFARWIEAEALVTEHGLLLKEPILDKQGGFLGHRYKKNPACTAALACQREMRALIAAFGMDPSNRSRLKAGGEEEKLSPLAQLLREKQASRVYSA